MNITRIFKEYIEKLKKNIFFQNVAVVTGGNVLAKLTGFISAPIITRLYTPADYGIFTVFMSVIAITRSLSTLRYAVTIPIASEEKLADNILKLCFIITFSLTLLMVIAFALFGSFVTEKFSIQKLGPYLWFIPVVFLGGGIYESLNNWAVRTKKFKLITRTMISQSISASVIKIGFGALKITPLGLFLGQATQVYTGIGSLFLKLKKDKPLFFNNFSWTEIKSAAIRYKDFPLIQSWSQLLLAMGAQLPVLLIGAFYGTKVVGIFGLAFGMIALPMNLLGQAVSQVYYAEISKYGKNEPEKIYHLSISIIKKMFWIALIPMGIIILFGPKLFGFVFGPQWDDAGKFAQFLSFLILTRFISSPIASLFNVYEKQGLQLLLNITRIILILVIFFVCAMLKLDIFNTILIYSVSMSLYYVFLLIIILKTSKKN